LSRLLLLLPLLDAAAVAVVVVAAPRVRAHSLPRCRSSGLRPRG